MCQNLRAGSPFLPGEPQPVGWFSLSWPRSGSAAGEREGAPELGASKSLDLGEIVKTRADEFPLWAPTDCPSVAKVELQKFFFLNFSKSAHSTSTSIGSILQNRGSILRA